MFLPLLLILCTSFAAACSNEAGAPPAATYAVVHAPQAPTTRAVSAEKLLAEYDAIVQPEFDSNRQEIQAEADQWQQKQAEYERQRADVAGRFLTAYPTHARAPDVLWDRMIWLMWQEHDGGVARTRQEIAAIRGAGELPLPMVKMLDCWDARAALRAEPIDFEDARRLTMKVVDGDPNAELRAEFAPRLLSTLAARYRDAGETESMNEILDLLIEKYPQTAHGEGTRLARERRALVGQPFEISFADAVTGRQFDSETLRGKVLVVEFWATWCGPCVMEMPQMKQVYARYKDKSVEFVGVSLDEPIEKGGREALLTFVRRNQITWPQYYLGGGEESEFAKRWKVAGIPEVFVIDAAGTLRTTDGRGKLDEWLPKLIAERDGQAGGPATRPEAAAMN